MKNLTIFVDMDGTIERLLDVWLTRLNAIYSQNVTPDMITSWDISKAYKNISSAQVLAVLDDDSIWAEVEPIEYAQDILKYLIDAGHKVYIVTATPYQSIKAKMEDLLFRCFPFLSWDNVIITNNKQLLYGDIMIDDALHNLIGGRYRKILFDAPYNRDISDQDNDIIRVKNWLEIKDWVDSIANN